MDKLSVDTLDNLCTGHGLFSVLVVLREIAKSACKRYASVGNHDGVIHRETAELSQCIDRMKQSNPLSGVRETMVVKEIKNFIR